METGINSGSGVQPSPEVRDEVPAPDITGAELPSGFRVRERLNRITGETDVYSCAKGFGMAEYTLRYYHRRNAVDERALSRLAENRHPGIVPVPDFGVFREHQYVILPNYRKKSLADALREGRRFTLQDLKRRIIPAVNEALSHIHALGMVHGALSPAVLMTENVGDRIVLACFGTSPEASGTAPEENRNAGDYRSLGLTVYELYTGKLPFQEGDSSSGISFPEGFPEDLRELVSGLTSGDPSGRRWGFQEVRNWLNGIPNHPDGEPGRVSGTAVPATVPAATAAPEFSPYTFSGKSCTDVSSLTEAMLLEPEAGMPDLRRGALSDHFGLYDEKLAEMVRKAETDLRENPEHGLAIFCTLMYRLNPGNRRLYAGGRIFSGVGELAEAVLSAAASGNDRRMVFQIAALLRGGFFAYVFRNVLSNRNHAGKLEKIETALRNESLTPEQTCCIFGYAFSDKRCFRIGDAVFTDPQNFQTVMKTLQEESPERYRIFIDENRDDIIFQRDHLPESRSRDIMKAALRDAEKFREAAVRAARKANSSGRRIGCSFTAFLNAGILISLLGCLGYIFLSDEYFGYGSRIPVLPKLPEMPKLPSIIGTDTDTPPESGGGGSPARRSGEPVLGGGSAAGSLSAGLDYERKGDFKSALRIFDAACQGGNASGCSRMGWYYQNGKGVPKDYPKALNNYKAGCAGGDGLGCYNLGWMYEKGSGVAQSYGTARTWYEKGCDLGNAHSCTALGYIWQHGLGVGRNKDNAIGSFEKACRLGHNKACEIRNSFVFVE